MQVPIETRHLFPIIDKKLIELLRSLTPGEWEQPTIAKLWTVKDIVAHLLDGNLRMLSFSRDKFFGEKPPIINSYDELVVYLNCLNADWVKAAKRISPNLLIEMLELSGIAYADHIASLDPFAEAVFPVAWAGERVSRNWFHIAREYTEKWIHQQQVRTAVKKPGLMERQLFYPFIDTFMQGMPHTFRDVPAEKDTVIKIVIDGEGGGDWYLLYNGDQWKIIYQTAIEPLATVNIPPDTAWRLFSKGISIANARKSVSVSGDKVLGEKVLTMVAVMA